MPWRGNPSPFPPAPRPVWLRKEQINMEAKLKRGRKNRMWKANPSESGLSSESLLRLVGRCP